MINRIFTDIARAVDQEAQQVISHATRVAERERAHARADAAQLLAAAQAAAQHDACAQAERADARRAADTRRSELTQRDQFVNAILARAQACFAALPRDARYVTWLRNTMQHGLQQIGADQVVIACNARDAAVVRTLLTGATMTLAEQPAPIVAGVILHSADGRVTLDCSADALLEQARDDLRDAILNQLHLPD
jgi:vacuolar-type H+-ATPase subunit E/Vma4